MESSFADIITPIIVALITSAGIVINTMVSKKVEIKTNDINEKIDKIGISNCKNFLVQVLSDLGNGQPVDDVVMERFYEQLDEYTNVYKLNSYIHAKVEKLKKEGKLL